jgi:hypothetical protein
VHQIESGLFRRQGKALTNSTSTLADAAIGPGTAGAQGPVQVRFPHARRGFISGTLRKTLGLTVAHVKRNDGASAYMLAHA